MEKQVWNSKIKFFSKFLGFDQYQFQETFEQSYRSQIRKTSSKGINLVKNTYLSHSSSSISDPGNQYDKNWAICLQTPFHTTRKAQVQQLIKQSTSIPRKTFSWLSNNRQKMNVRLYNIKKQQYKTNFKLQALLKHRQSLLAHNQNYLDIVGAFLLSRQDVIYSPVIENISATVLFYTNQTPIISYSLITLISTSQAFIGISTNNHQLIQTTISRICERIYKNCGSSTFIKRNQIVLNHFVLMWIESFWLCLQDNGSQLRQKIFAYLLVNKVSFNSVCRICEATIASLARLINQGIKQKIIYTLTNPKIFIDEEIFIEYMLSG